MKKICVAGCLSAAGVLLPALLWAQGMGKSVEKMHTTLETIKNDMLPLCRDLILVAQAIGGFGALFYIGVRVWRHIANAEPIDFFPLFRPFVMTVLIGLYPTIVLGLLDGLLKPTVLVTAEMVKTQNNSVKVLLQQRANIIGTHYEQVPLGTPGNQGTQDWNKYQQPGNNSSGNSPSMFFGWGMLQYSIMYVVKWFLSILLQIVYYAASICIDVMRTFHLIILSILGPFVFAISIFDGFQQSLITWLGRYLNIYLWLPISNLFGAMIARIQANMLQVDMQEVMQGNPGGFGQTDAAYLIFLILAIVGYFSIPSIANYIVHAGGGSSLQKRAGSLVGIASKFITKK